MVYTIFDSTHLNVGKYVQKPKNVRNLREFFGGSWRHLGKFVSGACLFNDGKICIKKGNMLLSDFFYDS